MSEPVPNGIADPDGARAALDLAEDDEKVAIVLGFGYLATPRDPSVRRPTSGARARTGGRCEEVVRSLP